LASLLFFFPTSIPPIPTSADSTKVRRGVKKKEKRWKLRGEDEKFVSSSRRPQKKQQVRTHPSLKVKGTVS
jgi:hypothetical protein